MIKTNITTYYIQLSKQDNKNVKLDKLPITSSLTEKESYKSINNMLLKLFEENKNNDNYMIIDENKKEYLELNCYKGNDNIFYGEFLYGLFGTEHQVKNIKTDAKQRKLSKEDAPLTPFYFYIEIIPNNEKGLLILETKKIGIKSIFEKWFKKSVKEYTNNELNLNLERFVPKKYAEKFLENSILTKIRFIDPCLPKEFCGEFDENNTLIKDGYMEVSIKISKRNKVSPINDISKKIKKAIPWVDNNSDIKLEVDSDGTKRTIPIKDTENMIPDLDNIIPFMDITNKLKKGKDGHRTFESIHNATKEYAEYIVEDIKHMS